MNQEDNDNLKKIGNYVVDIEKKLGNGNFGTVYLGYKLSKPDIPLAVKILDMELYQNENSLQNQEMLKREIKILKSAKSPYIVDMKDIFRTSHNIYMFLRYANGGDLQKKLNNLPQNRISEQEGMKYFAQLVEGYKALYANDIIHRDIKPANVLIDNGIALLSDFGLGKITPVNASEIQEISIQGTPYYRSPQLLKENKTKTYANNKCDVWSMGTMLYEMLNGKRPWNGCNIPDYDKNIRAKPLKFYVPLSPEVTDLILSMLKIEEKDRISWEEVFQHPAILQQNIPEEP